MRKTWLLTCFMLMALSLWSQPPDDPVSPVEAVSMLGKGILFEPQAGNVDLQVSAPYKPEYGDLIREAGFTSVRIRYQGSRNPMIQAIKQGPPYDADDEALLDELEGIVDDLLGKGLAVVITFYGLTEDEPGDLEKMVSWWGFVAERFKNKSHRLLFDLFVEPWKLVLNDDPQRIAVYYREITKEIRKTNPDRLLIYFKVPPQNYKDNLFGPGEDWFITRDFDPVPPEAGIWYMWDFHVLKDNARDDLRLIDQAWEYSDSAKRAVWSGAWASKTDDTEMWYAMPIAIHGTRRFIDRGIPSAYLMMFDGGTGIFDAQRDHNGNGIYDEWSWPGLVDTLTAGPDVWWNLLSDPGFEQEEGAWSYEGGTASRVLLGGEHAWRVVPDAGGIAVSQDVTLALANNGPGKTDFLAYIVPDDTVKVRFVFEGVSSDGSFVVESEPVTLNSPRLLNEELDLAWTGELQNAQYTLVVEGGGAYLDKMGLTRFFYDDPVMDLSLWPGERLHNESYSSRTTSTIDLNILTRTLLNKGKSDGIPSILTLTHAIDSVTYDLETRLIELIGSDYQRTAEGTQYRLGGYYQGPDNGDYKVDVEKYIGGKDAEAYALNQALIARQNEARDHLILTNLEYRSFFYEVWRGWPPSMDGKIPLDDRVTVDGITLTAAESGAQYRWLDCSLLLNPIPGATERGYTPGHDGCYAVEISKNGFTVISSCYTVSGVGVPAVKAENRFRLFPNPASDHVTMKYEGPGQPLSLRIYRSEGILVKQLRWQGGTTWTLLLRQPPGIYLFVVDDDQGRQVKKLLIR